MEISLTQGLKQQQVLSTQIIQTLALLPMNVTELNEYVQKEIESNPALEIPDYEPEIPEISGPEQSFDKEADDYQSEYSDSYDYEASDRKQSAIENSDIYGESLQEHLKNQLSECDVPDTVYEICENLIGNLDQNGFFLVSLESLFEEKNYSEDDITQALSLVRTFDPYGICAKDYKESLIIQAKCSGMQEADLKIFSELVNNYLDAMQSGKSRDISKRLGISTEDLETYWSILKSFTPYPGRSYSSEADNYVIPEFSVHIVDGSLEVEMNRGNFPQVSISEDFKSLAKDITGPAAKETAEYISESMKKARSLISQLEMRYNTMFNAATAIVEFQRDFFFHGPRALKTLTLKKVADSIGVHETTMSRLCQNKWVETDFGILPMKYFFSQGVEEVSRNAVKDMIADIVKENPKLSDRKISDILAEKGIKCARRTVNKYRSEM